MSTAAASATKWRSASCLLICALTLPLNAQSNPQVVFVPISIKCDIGRYQEQRPEKWQFMLRKEFADGKKTVEWHSEHDSAKSAMKECEKVRLEQNKIWKQQEKEQAKAAKQ